VDFGLLRAAGSAYLDFATRSPDLTARMVATKADDMSGPVHDAALRLFTAMTALVSLRPTVFVMAPQSDVWHGTSLELNRHGNARAHRSRVRV
jgi:hypothetical protein